MSERQLVLFVDDEAVMRQAVTQWLGLGGFEVVVHDQAATAIAALSPDFPGILVTDLKMEGTDGMDLLRRSLQIDPELPVIRRFVPAEEWPRGEHAHRSGLVAYLFPFAPEQAAA